MREKTKRDQLNAESVGTGDQVYESTRQTRLMKTLGAGVASLLIIRGVITENIDDAVVGAFAGTLSYGIHRYNLHQYTEIIAP